MRVLTQTQINFIAEYFFSTYCLGGYEIGKKLVMTGTCVIAGLKPIFTDPIDEFITTKVAEDFIDCLEYKFDLEKFLSSPLYRGIKNSYISILQDKKTDAEQALAEIQTKLEDIINLS